MSEGRRWRRLVAQVLERHMGKCVICGHYGSNSADHVIPVTEAPEREWDESNILPAHAWPRACPECSAAADRPVYCNSIKGGMSLERAQRKLREMTRLPIGLEAEHRRGPEGREL